MRIGILTFHRSINYGAFMQCLALSHEMQKRLPDDEVEVVDYNSVIMENNYKVRPRLNRHALGHPLEFGQKIKRKKAFRRALRFLPLSPEQIIDDGCDRVFDYIRGRYDLVVTGSDAVWNWIKRGFPNPYLLGFGDGPRRMSYGASAFGMGMKYLTDERKEKLSEWFSGYEYVGVRDEHTASLVRECSPEIKVEFNCDPTAFLDLDYVYSLLGETRETFRRRIYEKYHIPGDKRLICVMGTDRRLVRKIREKYRDTHRVIAVFSETGAEDVFMYDLDPLEWSLVFGLCDLTLTNFFHGTLLSLRNSTPVISIDHTDFGAGGKGKMEDALERMDLRDCFFVRQDALADGWERVLAKADELISDRNIRNIIESNRRRLVESAESFFAALGCKTGSEDISPAPRRICRVDSLPGASCAGCGLCAVRCPAEAITFIRENGFDMPSIDKEKCTGCGLCSRICPVNRPPEPKKPSRVVALCDRDEKRRAASSSGGAVGLFADLIFKKGGAVSGVVYDGGMRPVFRIARSEEEYAPMRGSKYVQASTEGLFAALESELAAGRPVLMTGVPCQTAAVREYFGGKYDGLYTLDLICHGVQSPELFACYISRLEKKYGSRVTDFRFRDKANGWKKSNVRVVFENGEELIMTRAECDYFRYFDYLRNSCYRCRFRGFRSAADLTVGDYWGVETLTDLFSDDRGASIVLCNTAKGEELLCGIEEGALTVESDIDHALATHRKLTSSIPVPPPRNRFFDVLGRKGCRKAIAYHRRRTLPYNVKVRTLKLFKK